MRKARILVVEDEGIVALGLQRDLETLGYDVPMTVDSGEEAIEQAAELQPDLVLMDIKLAGEMDGIKAAARLRSRFDIPVVYLTAFADDSTLQQAKVTEPFGYIIKPYGEKELSTAIEIALYRHRMEKRLKESEEKYHSLFFAVDYGVVLHEMVYNSEGIAVDYIILDVNPAYEVLTGLTKAQAVGSRASELYKIEEPPYLEKYTDVVESGNTTSFETYFPQIGKYFSLSAFCPARGMFATIFTDVTDRKLAEQRELELALEKERTGLLRKFIRDVSHDFRTPLATINAALYIIMKSNNPDERERRADLIEQQVTRITRLLSGLLAMTRLDSGVEFDFRPLNLNQMLRDIASGPLCYQAEEKGLVITLNLDEEMSLIPAAGEELIQALTNIVENAVQYTPAPGTITLRTHVQADYAVTEVRDTGAGITEDDLLHIFDRLWRADGVRNTQTGGGGLGLSIAKKIVEIHGGKIEAESTLGEGSTFTVKLPVSREWI